MDALLSQLDLIYSYIAFALAYLIGSLSFAVIVSRLMGLNDPRTYGTKNPGATNVLRSGNKLAAVLTLLFDALKGAVPVLLAGRCAPALGLSTSEGADTLVAFVGLAAFVGHLFPVFFRFRGGKGVATAAGVLLAVQPGLGLATLAVWLLMALMFRYSSLASIVAAITAPFFMLMFYDRPVVALSVAIMSLLLLWRHWRNIINLMTGRETKLGQKAGEVPRRQRRRRLHEDVRPSTHGAATPSKFPKQQ